MLPGAFVSWLCCSSFLWGWLSYDSELGVPSHHGCSAIIILYSSYNNPRPYWLIHALTDRLPTKLTNYLSWLSGPQYLQLMYSLHISLSLLTHEASTATCWLISFYLLPSYITSCMPWVVDSILPLPYVWGNNTLKYELYPLLYSLPLSLLPLPLSLSLPPSLSLLPPPSHPLSPPLSLPLSPPPSPLSPSPCHSTLTSSPSPLLPLILSHSFSSSSS